MIEQVRNDENDIPPRSPLYFGWDVKQLRFLRIWSTNKNIIFDVGFISAVV